MTPRRLALDRSTLRKLAWAIVLMLIGASPSLASSYREIETFEPVVDQVRQYAGEVGAENVLVVVDIDNTLLAMDTDLGSDQWFEWQEYLLGHKPNSPHLVAEDFPGLLAVQGLLFATTHMHPPEPEQPRWVSQIQGTGVATVVLTSRGEEFRPATLRELERAGYEFGSTAPSIKLFKRNGRGDYETASRFTPYRLDRPRAYGLTPEEVKIFELSDEPRQVSYGDGVMMTAGQHKGAMLLVLLHLIDHKYDRIVYVDDHGRHVHRVYDTLARRGVEVTAMHYQHEDARVKQFAYGNKRPVTRRWREIDRALGFFDLEPAGGVAPR